MVEPTWDELVDWHLQPRFRRAKACRLATGRSADFVESVWQRVKGLIPPPYERTTRDGLSPTDSFRFIIVKILQFIKYAHMHTCAYPVACACTIARVGVEVQSSKR